MKIYFEDGLLTKNMCKLPPNLKHSINASYGVTNNIRLLEDIKNNEPMDTVIYTNDISALNSRYAWNHRLNSPDIYFRAGADNEFYHINCLTERVLHKDDDIAKLYVTGELFSINRKENGTMYLIKKLYAVTCDPTEKGFGNQICEETIGILDCEDEETVTKWIEDHKPDHQYVGWDGKVYPYYTKTPINVLRLNDKPVEKKPNDIKSIKEILEEANRYEDIKTILTKIITEDDISSTYRVEPFIGPNGITKWSVKRDDVKEEARKLLEIIDSGAVHGECARGIFRNLERYISYNKDIKLRCYAVAEANNNHTPGDTTIDDILNWLLLDDLLFGLNRPYVYKSHWKIPEKCWK